MVWLRCWRKKGRKAVKMREPGRNDMVAESCSRGGRPFFCQWVQRVKSRCERSRCRAPASLRLQRNRDYVGPLRLAQARGACERASLRATTSPSSRRPPYIAIDPPTDRNGFQVRLREAAKGAALLVLPDERTQRGHEVCLFPSSSSPSRTTLPDTDCSPGASSQSRIPP